MIYEFLADGFEEVEAITPVDLLRRAGLEVKTVSIMDSVNVMGTHGIPVGADGLFGDFDYSDAELLILPGGMPGTSNLMAHEGLAKLLVKQNEEGKRIAAICAAPMFLGKLGIVNGKKAICYPGCEGELKGAEITNINAITDGMLTTGRGPGAAMDFGIEIIRALLGNEKADAVKAELVYR